MVSPSVSLEFCGAIIEGAIAIKEESMVTPQELHNYLKTNPGFTWATLPTEHRELMSTLVRHTGSFSQEQIDFLKDFWLVVSPEQLEEMQGKLPPRLGLMPKETTGGIKKF